MLGLMSAIWNVDLMSEQSFFCPQAVEMCLRLLLVHILMKSVVSMSYLSSLANPLGLKQIPGEIDDHRSEDIAHSSMIFSHSF